MEEILKYIIELDIDCIFINYSKSLVLIRFNCNLIVISF